MSDAKGRAAAWDPAEYLKFSNERSRPFFDLLDHISLLEVERVVDLGCGPGNLTRYLAERWPMARVTGVDRSREMLEQAQRHALFRRLNFVEADLIEWSTDEPVDLLFSNAALQWVPNHATLIERLARMVAPRGTFAAQMPINRYDPSHEAIRKVAADRRWASRLDGVGLDREWVQPATWYVERLHALGFGVNAWETTYVHVMRGEEPVLAWLRGTALRPIVAALEPAEASVFERCLADELHRAYPPQGELTLMPKARVFFVATRKSTESSQVRR